jgi:hypothetical protein
VVEGRAADGKCEPVVDVRMHQHPVFSPPSPPARGNRHDAVGVARCLALEVVSADERRARARNLQHEEALEQPHRWPHPHIHLVQLDEDGHQSDGVWRKMLQLEPMSYPVFMPKPSTHRMHDPGSNVPHIRPKEFTENQIS